MAIVRLASGEASFTIVVIAPSIAIPAAVALVAINRRISSIRLDDETDDDLSVFRGCFTPPAQNTSYMDSCYVISSPPLD
jgi:hypothetical protein